MFDGVESLLRIVAEGVVRIDDGSAIKVGLRSKTVSDSKILRICATSMFMVVTLHLQRYVFGRPTAARICDWALQALVYLLG